MKLNVSLKRNNLADPGPGCWVPICQVAGAGRDRTKGRPALNIIQSIFHRFQSPQFLNFIKHVDYW